MKENDFEKISPDDAMKMLAKEGLLVSREQAISILNLLYKLAGIALDTYLKEHK